MGYVWWLPAFAFRHRRFWDLNSADEGIEQITQIHRGSSDWKVECRFDLMFLKCCELTPRCRYEIVEILGIRSWFPQMASVFCCGTWNGEDYRKYGGTKLPIHYIDVRPFEGCDYSASWTKGIDLGTIMLTDVCYLRYGGPRRYLYG